MRHYARATRWRRENSARDAAAAYAIYARYALRALFSRAQ